MRRGRGIGRLAVLAERDFRVFYCGYVTSLLGSAMSGVALTFAVLGTGGTPADLGFVLAARVLPQVAVMLGAGILADRLGRRPVMLVTDTARMTVQATLAAALLAGRPPIWVFVALSAVLAVGEGFFTPALGGLRADIVPASLRQDGNALLTMAQSGTSVLGPALAGVLVAITGPAAVIAVDAASYGASVLALATLTIPAGIRAAQSPWRDLADGWRQFRAQTWLWVKTLQFALFNLFTWAPFLLLGPILAKSYLGGARAWGTIMAAYAAGSVLAGLAVMGRSPRRPLVIATIGTFGFPIPCLMLALHAGVVAVIAGAGAAGAGSGAGTFTTTVMQQRVPPDMLARTTAFMLTGAFALGASGWIVIGPVAQVVGPGRVLGFAAAYSVLSSAVVLAMPAIRSVRWQDPPATAGVRGSSPGIRQPASAGGSRQEQRQRWDSRQTSCLPAGRCTRRTEAGRGSPGRSRQGAGPRIP